MSIDFDEHGYRKVKPDDYFRYDCSGCGDCCRNVKDAVMVESLDLYRLARFLGMEMGEFALQYTNTAFLAPAFPILMLKTKQHMDACIFLKASRCGIHSSKPRTCRTYPLGIGPDDERPGSWLHFIVSKKQHHFTGRRRRVGDWMSESLTPEDLPFVTADYACTGALAKLMKRIGSRHEDDVVKLIMCYRYVFYDMDEDFMPQYTRNMELLKERLERLGRG